LSVAVSESRTTSARSPQPCA